MHTPEFRRHFAEFVPGDTLMMLRLATKVWNTAADVLIDEGVESGMIIVHDGKDISLDVARAREERRKLVTRVIFLLDITKVGQYTCWCAINLVVVDIPEGVESISIYAFSGCPSLTTISFLTTLKSIGRSVFYNCFSLDNVDLLNTNLQEIDRQAFQNCSELKSMIIPDSLQTLGSLVIYQCSKLVPSNIGVSYDSDGDEVDTTSDVVAHLRTRMQIAEKAALKQQLTDQGTQVASLKSQVAWLKTQMAEQTTSLKTQIADQGSQIVSLKTQIAEQGASIISALKSEITSLKK
ncbi:hypothetical protein TL16_g02781 [Triparma laevis f. inornata]|uniref:Uncharacterized protein n=2 Tax=Triparma laevis TaxID=1534972 RepID=A0A9W6ZNA1_9STRA|nr:hypothetical protein TrLO_g10738 [Triparma laevis f. longispina]GMH59220.1 hypothetical protein TL16_g02781 [Triparma laevis f. inornata]